MDSAIYNIHGDGIKPSFYYLLWSKDELNYGLTLNVPDTIIYKFGQPIAWYFTAKDGKVKKKNKNNLINIKIEQKFTKKAVGFDVIAAYISETEEEGTQVEYLTRQGLRSSYFSIYSLFLLLCLYLPCKPQTISCFRE